MTTRRVRRRTCREKGKGKEVVEEGRLVEAGSSPPLGWVAAEDGDGDAGRAAAGGEDVDWTLLPDDTVLQLFGRLSYRDRGSLGSTCRTWRALGSSPCLWTALDLRAHRCDAEVAASLASRCAGLRRLRLRGHEAAMAVASSLRASGLREVVADGCRGLTDATLAVLAARHEALESLQIGPEPLERVSSDALRHVALCCSSLRRLRLSGLREADADAIGALARYCPLLEDVAFLDCGTVDEAAIGDIRSLRFLSVAGCYNLKWATASASWEQLPSLVAVDVSRTDVSPSAVSRLISHSKTLELICALNCKFVEEEQAHSPTAFSNSKGKLVLTITSDIFESVAELFPGKVVKEQGVFNECNWRGKSKALGEMMIWLEWILSQSLLRIAESNPYGMDNFWLQQGTSMLLSLVKSSQEDVQERAATTLATFVVIDDETANVDAARSEAVMRDGGIPLLLDLARSSRVSAQSEAAKAIANLSVNAKVAKVVADEGGITIFTNLAKSMNRSVAEEAAGGLWNLSVGEEHKTAIAGAGGIKALVDLIFRWPAGTDGVLERAAGALANLAADDKCSLEVAKAGGVHALVTLARSCKLEGVLEQAARALANLAAHGDNNTNNAAVGQEAGALEALVQLTCSQNEGVRQEVAGALWNLSFDDKNREAIAAAGGVEALVSLAQQCLNASDGLQERAAGALWGLSVSEANSIAIGQEGGVTPLLTMACSEVEDVHETAAGALWNLAFYSSNALRIVEEGGVPILVHLCSSSGSKMARFMSALALAYMFDGRMNEAAILGTSSEGSFKGVNVEGARRMALKHIEIFVLTFSDPQVFSMAAASSAPAALSQVAEAVFIQEAGHLRCSGAEVGRFIAMLRNPTPVLRACAAFALLQFTIPGGRHAVHHAGLLQKAGAARVLRAAAAATSASIEAKVFARIVLRNLEHNQAGTST
ncbi:protein ARABIDILLO 1 [Lolium perenne]|uniref:protein ARABIDILLO 1 n=1 Tax=Lolium perenne TaxID=4522 RepID=UPI0021F5E194|nr:protein ARABIDILLO 1-like [Lolium perenne]XP_051196596.1 protein ARABIDILLO 1-like [Lolium perenne]